MTSLTIDIDAVDGQTVSKFATYQGDKIAFHNKDAAAKLTVTIEGATDAASPICDANGPVPTFEVPAGRVEEFWVCGDLGDFKYTATIFGATPEDPRISVQENPCKYVKMDPIVIIDWAKCGFSNPNPIVIIDEQDPVGGSILMLAGAAILGAMAGIVVVNLLRGRGTGRGS